MDTIFIKMFFEISATCLVAIIAWFIKQMSTSLKRIEKDINTLNNESLLFQQKTEMRLDTIEKQLSE